MKPTTIKSAPISACNKTKKANKEREKRKSQNLNESPSQNSGCSSPNKDPSNCKYAGLSVESLHTYNEQATFEHLSDEICTGFTEDLNYKVRQIIHEALIKATLSGRNYINSDDIDNVFECLNVEKVYGAPTLPIWLTLGENNITYLDDTKINLIEIAEEECTAVQPGDITTISRWLNESSGPTEAQRNYYVTLCNSVIDNRKDIREMALKDLRENTKIGPFCEWFYQFGYSLLSKDITYNSLTLYALRLIEALEANPIAPQSVSEARLELLVRLILQRLLQQSAAEVLEPMCRVLTILCNRIPLHDFVKSKIKKKFYKIKSDLPFQTVHIINSLGVNGIKELLLPSIDYFLKRIEEYKEQQLIEEVLATYNILCCEKENTRKIDERFFETFGESLMVYWRFDNNPNIIKKLTSNG
ncbi:uncharacterized protein LOC108734301 isoform X2 [Agrilus planipennis]|uniref:Transcription initiation factor TFIID subunit 6 n=1 Tax=Agrilus planipennis TaxID=224129 RepID=A0A1W4WLG0_AGRPL|nr:uncharacterized protein LOC108734301 isoform X2 [Agrilus planipennis]